MRRGSFPFLDFFRSTSEAPGTVKLTGAFLDEVKALRPGQACCLST